MNQFNMLLQIRSSEIVTLRLNDRSILFMGTELFPECKKAAPFVIKIDIPSSNGRKDSPVHDVWHKAVPKQGIANKMFPCFGCMWVGNLGFGQDLDIFRMKQFFIIAH